jgi:hypothetical protein
MRDRDDPSLISKAHATSQKYSGRIKRLSCALSCAHSFLLFRHDVGYLPALRHNAVIQKTPHAQFGLTKIWTYGSRSSISHPLNSRVEMDSLSRQDDAHPAQDAHSVPDRGPALIIMMWTLTALSLFTVVLRFIFRVRKRQMGWDDIFMGITWVRKSARLAKIRLTKGRHAS